MDRRVAWVTGAQGFVGHHLCAALHESGWVVMRFGRDTAAGNHSAVLPLSAPGFIRAVALQGMPERVFHLAGGATVGQSLADPLGDFDNNVRTTALVLDAVRQFCPNSPVILASSAAVYGSSYPGAIPTDAVLQPYSPYGHHKRMAEQLALAYAESFGLRLSVLRLFSIYGPGIRKQLLFDICTQLAKGDGPVRLGGTGRERRDWCHVADVVRAMTALTSPLAGQVETLNLGTGQGLAIHDVASLLIQVWGGTRQIVFSGQSRPGDPFSLIAAPDSLPPGFSPQIEVAEGFALFVDWFRADQMAETQA